MIENDLESREEKNQKENIKNLRMEYENLKYYEIELFKNRWTVFVALMSVSFIVYGIGLKDFTVRKDCILLIPTFLLASFIYLIGFYHYIHFHKLAHLLRERGQELERDIGIKKGVMDIRVRYSKGTRPFHSIIFAFTIIYLVSQLGIILYCLIT